MGRCLLSQAVAEGLLIASSKYYERLVKLLCCLVQCGQHLPLSTALFLLVQAVEALIPHNQKPPSGLPQLVQLCCTFGSTLMLPLLFIGSSLAGEAAVQAIGYTSLFHAAWSPLFWVLGYNLLAAAAWSVDGGAGRSRRVGE
jgi:hypothetical protein